MAVQLSAGEGGPARRRFAPAHRRDTLLLCQHTTVNLMGVIPTVIVELPAFDLSRQPARDGIGGRCPKTFSGATTTNNDSMRTAQNGTVEPLELWRCDHPHVSS
jgi:hypothetical protein